MSFHPDREYIYGVLEERQLGEFEHSAVQAFLTYLFGTRQDTRRVRVLPEYRVQVAPTSFRVPDLTIVPAETPRQTILRTLPLLVVEILSPEDTLNRLRMKVGDYLAFGIEHIWVIDPYGPHAYLADARGFHEPVDGSSKAILAVPGTPLAVSLAGVWRELDPA